MKNVYKWRIVTNKYLYLTDENNAGPFIFNKITKERIYECSGTPQVDDYGVDEGEISQIVSEIRDTHVYETMFNNMVNLAMCDTDAQKLHFLTYDNYFNLDSEECVQEAVTPKCEGYEPVFNISAHTIDETEVSYTFFPERNEQDKTLRYKLDLGIPRGLTGEKGEAGESGCQGAKGDDGKSAVIVNADATVRVLPVGSTPEAQVEVVPESATTENENQYVFHFDFGLPKGAQGDSGPQGNRGANGKDAIITDASATIDPLEYGQQPQVSVSAITTPTQEENQTELRFHFDIPAGPQGEVGPAGAPAIISKAEVTQIETLPAGSQATVSVSAVTLSESDNTYELLFEFGIPEGQPGASGGGGGGIYNFENPVKDLSGNPVGSFTVTEMADGTHSVELTLWNSGGGGETDIKHRYEATENGSDSLSEGVKDVVNGVAYPKAIASGARSHAEGIGGDIITGVIHLHAGRIYFYFPYEEEGYTMPFNKFENKKIIVNGEEYTLIPNGSGWTDDINEWTDYGTIPEDFDYEATFRDFIVKDAGGQILDESGLTILEGTQVVFNVANVSNAIGIATHTEGSHTRAIGHYSHAEGYGTLTDESGDASHAEGGYTTASGDYSHAEGFGTLTGGGGAHAEGYAIDEGEIRASGDGSHVQGYADGTGSTISSEQCGSFAGGAAFRGGMISAEDDASFAFGSASNGGTIKSTSESAHAEGYAIDEGTIIADGEGSNAQGYADGTGSKIYAGEQGAHAEGYAVDGGTISATGFGSHAEGCNTNASGDGSHAEGIGYPEIASEIECTLSSNCGTTLSRSNIIVNEYWVIGIIGSQFEYNNVTYTIKEASHFNQIEQQNTVFTNIIISEGGTGSGITIEELLGGYNEQQSGITLSGVTVEQQKNAIGIASHSEGKKTVAEGDYSHSEGNETMALGVATHAEGCNTVAYGDYSHASGFGTQANNNYMTAIGKFNETGNTNTLFAIGDGADNANRSDVVSVDGYTKKVILSNNGGIQIKTGGSGHVVWNTNGGTTDLNSFIPTVSVPAGTIQMYAGSSAPTGWLLCDGSAISRTAYANLYNVCGDTYGAGDGSTTFNLPNLQQRFPLGVSTNYTLGVTGGTETVTLTENEMPEHSHGITQLDPSTEISQTGTVTTVSTQEGSAVFIEVSGNGTEYRTTGTMKKGTASGSSYNNILSSSGSGQAHNNMPPYLAINFIIKY